MRNVTFKKIKPMITKFRLVREGPPEDTFNETIKYNYFDDKYNNETIIIFLKINEISQIYRQRIMSMLRIFYRTIRTELNIKILSTGNEMNISLPLGLENSYSKLISTLQGEIHQEIGIPHHIFQDNQNLDEITNEEDMKNYAKTGLILFLYPKHAQFVNKLNNAKISILLKYDRPLSFYLPELYQKLSIEDNSENYMFQIQNQENDTALKISIDTPIHQILKKQKWEPVIFYIFENLSLIFFFCFF